MFKRILFSYCEGIFTAIHVNIQCEKTSIDYVLLVSFQKGYHVTGRIFTLYLILLLSLVLPVSSFANEPNDNIYTENGLRWPIDASRFITSTFCEPRPGRFHAGIDFSTLGGTGFPCYAIDNGYIKRIKVNHAGYGKALYLQLPNGQIAVYAHLERFNDVLESHIRSLQEARGDYEVDIFLRPDEFPVNKGDVIAYSGQTGAGPPHLHFEMRHGMNVPFNPFRAGFFIDDTRLPYIRSVAIQPLDSDSEVESDMHPVVRRIRNGTTPEFHFYGSVGVSVKVVDLQDGGWHRLGPDRIEMYLDGELRHVTTMDSFKYADQRQSRMQYDFAMERNGLREYHNLFIREPNTLYLYDREHLHGIFNSAEIGEGSHTIDIAVYDFAGNVVMSSIPVVALSAPVMASASGNGPPRFPVEEIIGSSELDVDFEIQGTWMRVEASGVPEGVTDVEFYLSPLDVSHIMIPKRSGHWVGKANLPIESREKVTLTVIAANDDQSLAGYTEDIQLIGFPEDAGGTWSSPFNDFDVEISGRELWFDLVATVERLPQDSMTIAPVYSLRPYTHPFARPFDIYFHSTGDPWDTTAVVVYRDAVNGDNWYFLSNDLEQGGHTLHAQSLSFEDFSVALDTIPPEINSILPADGSRITTRRPEISAAVKDTLSGINLSECEVLLDGSPIIWMYDPDEKRIVIQLWRNLSRGEHSWAITIADNVGFVTSSSNRFVIQ